MAPMSDAAWTALSVAAAAVFGLLAERYRAVLARRAEAAREAITAGRIGVESRQVDVSEWRGLLGEQREMYEGHVDALTTAHRVIVESLRKDLEHAFARIENLERDRSNDQAQIETLTRSLDREKALSRTAARYIRELLAWVRVHVPDAAPPALPIDLQSDI